MFNDQHITALDQIMSEIAREKNGELALNVDAWRGSACRAWAQSVTQREHAVLPTARQNRAELAAFVQDGSLSDEDVYLAVMAWGGQHRRNGRAAWAGIERLLPIVGALREGHVDAYAGYLQFYEATSGKERVRGIGPAYYSKLVYFLSEEGSAAIMDQWTAKSMQLLAQRREKRAVIRLSNGYVAADNDVAVYATFCGFIGQIANRYGITMGNAEALLFSGSGERWRNYVVRNWTKDA